MPTRFLIERLLREVGARQHGVVTRAQLLALGVSRHAIDRMVRTERLAVLWPGVYQIGPVPVARGAERAALLACGDCARISHVSAAVLHGLLDASRAQWVDVTMARPRRRRMKAVHIHRVRELHSEEVTLVDGIAVTTPARTLLDLGAVLPSRDVEQALAKALRSNLVTRDVVLAMAGRHPYDRGAAILRSLLRSGADPSFTRSEAEERLLAIIRRARLPQPELNVRLLGYEVDFLWRRERLIVEADGYEFHASQHSFAADRQRDAALIAAGYRVLRFTWPDLAQDAAPTTVRIAQALVR